MTSPAPFHCAIIIVNYRTPDDAIACVRAVAAQAPATGWHVVLVDNASPDDSAIRLPAELADLIEGGFLTFLPLAHNGGFAWGNNQAMLHLHARGHRPEFIMLLNPDCIIESGAVELLIADLKNHPECAIAGSMLLNTDGSVTGCCFNFPTLANETIRALRLPGLGNRMNIAPVQIPPGTEGEVGWVSGAAFLIRTAALEQVGLMDDGYFLYYEEVDLMRRVTCAGWTIRHVPRSRVMHIGGASTGLIEGHNRSAEAMPDYWHESRRRYFTLAFGKGAGRKASLLWLWGDRIARIIGAFIAHRNVLQTDGDRAKIKIIGLHQKPQDHVPAIPRLGDPEGRTPTWMTYL